MRGVIAAIMAILGVILVLGGAASLWASALDRSRGDGTRDSESRGSESRGSESRGSESTGDESRGSESTAMRYGGGTRIERTLEVAGRLPGADRLITWGVVLLALSAVAAGAITFSATATAGTN